MSIESDPWVGDRPAPPRRPMPRPLVWGLVGCGGLAGLAFVGLVVVGFVLQRQGLSDTKALPGERLGSGVRDVLREDGLVGEDERVLYFFSDGFTAREEGVFFTDRRVVSYAREEGELSVRDARYPEIERILHEPGEGFFGYGTIDVWVLGRGTLQLLVSSEAGGDRKFAELLIATWERERGPGTLLPDGRTILADELGAHARAWLRDTLPLEEGEALLAVHAAPGVSLEAWGYACTDRRFVYFEGDEGQLAVDAVAHGELTDVACWADEEGTLYLEVESVDGEPWYHEWSGDLAEVERLVEIVRASAGGGEPR